MNSPEEAKLIRLFEQVKSGKLSPRDASDRLARLPIESTGFAKLDHHRPLRIGVPEAIFCPGKTLAQVVDLLGRLSRAGSCLE